MIITVKTLWPKPTVKPEQGSSSPQNDSPAIISTKPDPLEGAVIGGSETIELTFNKPLVNDPARVVIEPKVDFTVELSTDHKTIKITPKQPFPLGQGYTLTIKAGYGFDTREKLDQDIIFHFRTIKYQGV